MLFLSSFLSSYHSSSFFVTIAFGLTSLTIPSDTAPTTLLAVSTVILVTSPVAFIAALITLLLQNLKLAVIALIPIQHVSTQFGDLASGTERRARIQMTKKFHH